MNTITFTVEGMHCSGCAATIRALLENSAGVHKAAVTFDKAEARVLYDPRAITEAQLAAVIETGSYRVADERRG